MYLQYFEAYNALFRLENTLRLLVYIVLKEKYKNKWQDCTIKSDSSAVSIKNTASYKIKADKNYEYIGYTTINPLMYLMGGELINIITVGYWELFKEYFPGNLNNIKLKLDEIKNIRNALAHFRPIKDSDVDIIKINSTQVFPKIEKQISDMVNSHQVLPSNTNSVWYKNLVKIRMDETNLKFVQTSCKNWIRIKIEFILPIISDFELGGTIYYRIIKPQPTEILEKFSNLRKYVIICSEDIPYTNFNTEKPQFKKGISLTFSKKTLQLRYKSISNELQKVLNCVKDDYDLITADNSAKGDISINTFIAVRSVKDKGNTSWIKNDNVINTTITEMTPIEFWSSEVRLSQNFLSSTERFPWMIDKISEHLVNDLPF